MNKIAYMLLSAFVLLLSGCDKEGDKQVDITGGPAALSLSSADANVQIADGNRSGTVVFKTGGGSSHIDVATDRRAWTIGNTGDQWLTAEQDATGLVLKTAANTGSETLTATVTITAGSGEGAATATLEVSQRSAGDPDLTLDTHEVVFSPKDTEPKTVGVTTNQDDWTFETSSPSYWLLIEKGPDNTLVLTPDPNKMTENETIIVKVKAGYGSKMAVEELKAVNEAASTIRLHPDKLAFMKEGGSETVQVTANQSWKLGEITEKWFTATTEGDNIRITAYENDGQAQRSYRLPVICYGAGENTATAYIDIVQWGKDDDLLVLEYTTTSANTAVTLPLAGTVDCTVNWGDGVSEDIAKAKPEHRYATPGVYRVTVNGTVTGLNSSGLSSSKLLTQVVSWGRTGLTSMESALSGCETLTSLPADKNGSFAEVTTFESAFSGCLALESIPADLLAFASKATTFELIFSVGSSAAYAADIPAGLFDRCTAGENFSGVFWGRTLKSIPTGLFDRTTKATDFSYVFYQADIATVPDNLFSNCPGVTTFNSLFANSTLARLPGTIFKGCTQVTNMGYAFQNCANLEAIPEGIFAEMSEVEYCNYLFSNCGLIQSIPAGLFDAFGKAANASLMFNGCKSLEALPQGVFDKLVSVTNFSSAFQNCTALKTIPAGLFKNCAQINNIAKVFNGCSSIETVPGDIFNCPKVTKAANSASLFQNCTGLKTLPAGLLDSFTGATGFATLFNGCTSLESVPAGLFDNCKAVNSFASTFAGCEALTGESPYTVVEGAKVHLYERSADNGFKAPSTKTKCFNGCTGLSDYESIPATWK